MAKRFMDENFLLNSPTAETLFHEYAKDMAIFDYHSHVPAREIRENRSFRSITEIWLGGDHYKWRLMRTLGVDERYITGDGSDEEKFMAWAKTVSRAIGNPVYHWTHLELQRFFGVHDLLCEETGEDIYRRCNEFLASEGGRVRSLISQNNVKVICTTDDPTDDLEDHRALAEEDWGTKVLPTWRPDRALAAGNAGVWNQWVDKLSKASNTEIGNYRSFMEGLGKRHDFFHSRGCRISDYGIEKPYGVSRTMEEVDRAFLKVRGGTSLEGGELDLFRSQLLFDLLSMDAQADWTQQLHFGASRNPNSRWFEVLGPDTGFDTIGDYSIGPELLKLLDSLESVGKLARTVIYTLNPKDNDLIASILASFMDGRTPGKIQFGTAWWFNDHKAGMIRQMEALSSVGMLAPFVGMLTDSRSFLSYPRHEYFRRILCDFIGSQVERGEIPQNYGLLGPLVRDVCYCNAVKYFKIDV